MWGASACGLIGPRFRRLNPHRFIPDHSNFSYGRISPIQFGTIQIFRGWIPLRISFVKTMLIC